MVVELVFPICFRNTITGKQQDPGDDYQMQSGKKPDLSRMPLWIENFKAAVIRNAANIDITMNQCIKGGSCQMLQIS